MRFFTKEEIAILWLAMLAWRRAIKEADLTKAFNEERQKNLKQADGIIEKIELWYRRRK